MELYRIITNNFGLSLDSVYLAASAETLDEIVKPEMKHLWGAAKVKWFPRTDTAENAAYDKRTPGKSKTKHYTSG